MKPHKHAEVIKAWADGAQVQTKNQEGQWTDAIRQPYWLEHSEYRIKPVQRQLWARPYRHRGLVHAYPFTLEYTAQNGLTSDMAKYDWVGPPVLVWEGE